MLICMCSKGLRLGPWGLNNRPRGPQGSSEILECRLRSPSFARNIQLCTLLDVCACHPCAGAMLFFSASFQFERMIPEGNPSQSFFSRAVRPPVPSSRHAKKGNGKWGTARCVEWGASFLPWVKWLTDWESRRRDTGSFTKDKWTFRTFALRRVTAAVPYFANRPFPVSLATANEARAKGAKGS